MMITTITIMILSYMVLGSILFLDMVLFNRLSNKTELRSVETSPEYERTSPVNAQEYSTLQSVA